MDFQAARYGKKCPGCWHYDKTTFLCFEEIGYLLFERREKRSQQGDNLGIQDIRPFRLEGRRQLL
jgi:hypothetical protein